MKTRSDIAIANALDIATDDDKKQVAEVEAASKELKALAKKNSKSDYKYARENLKKIIKAGMELVDDTASLVKDVQSARMYESASLFFKTLSELNKDLVGISTEIDKMNSSGSPSGDEGESPTGVNVFVGSPSDIFKSFSKRNVPDMKDTQG